MGSSVYWLATILIVVLGVLVLSLGFSIVSQQYVGGQPYCDRLVGNENVSVVSPFGVDYLTNPSYHFCEYNKTFRNYTYNRTAFRDALSNTVNAP